MSASMFHCEHCKITMTGPENYKEHLEGKKHLRKLKVGSGIAPASQTKPAQNKLDQIKEKGYGGRFVKSSSETGTQDNQGNEGMLDQFSQAGVVNAAKLLETNDADPVMNAVKANILGKLPLKRPIFEGKCEVCEVEYTSKSHQEQHLSGKKHKKKMQTKEAMESINGATLYCGFCNLYVNSIEQMEQHRSGSSHNKKVENAKTSQQGTQPPHSAAKKKFVPSSGLETSDKLIMSVPPMPPAQLLDLKPLTYDK